MIYSVSFSFKPGSDDSEELIHIRLFFEDLKVRGLINGCRLLKDQKQEAEAGGGKYLALVEFSDGAALGVAMKEVAAIGYKSGAHDIMIGNVGEFSVGFWDVVDEL